MREAAVAEEGAEAEAEAAPRGRGRGGRDHRSDNFFSCCRGGCCTLGSALLARGFTRSLIAPPPPHLSPPVLRGPRRGRGGGRGEQRTLPERGKLTKLQRSAERVDARPRPASWRLHAGGRSAGLQCLLAKASAAGAAAARRMPRPHDRRGGSRCSRRRTRAPDGQGCW